MTETEVHAAALSDPDAQPLTAERLATMRRVVNVKKLRERLGLTQQAFAEAYGIPVGTLRDWEQRRKNPTPRLEPTWKSSRPIRKESRHFAGSRDGRDDGTGGGLEQGGRGGRRGQERSAGGPFISLSVALVP